MSEQKSGLEEPESNIVFLNRQRVYTLCVDVSLVIYCYKPFFFLISLSHKTFVVIVFQCCCLHPQIVPYQNLKMINDQFAYPLKSA